LPSPSTDAMSSQTHLCVVALVGAGFSFISTVGALAIVAFFGCPRVLWGFSNLEFRSIVVSSWILILSPRFRTRFGLARVVACVSHGEKVRCV